MSDAKKIRGNTLKINFTVPKNPLSANAIWVCIFLLVFPILRTTSCASGNKYYIYTDVMIID